MISQQRGMAAHYSADRHFAAEPSDGRQQVNRPFYAIGVLLAFLALAMLAVGLSSRPRPLAPTGTGPSAAGSGMQAPGMQAPGMQAPRHQPGPTAYVLFVPDAPVVEAVSQVAVCRAAVCQAVAARQPTYEQPTYEQGCGWDRETGMVYLPVREPATGLRSVRVEMARDPSQWTGPDDALRTGYDPDYDRAMDAALAPRRPATVLIDESADDDELVRRFQSLLPPSAASSAPLSRQWEQQLRTIYLGAANRLERLLNRGQATANHERGPTWSDYMAWIESQQATVAGLNTRVSASPFWGQPKDQVLQIAVSALNRVAEMLHAAVLRLMDGAAERLAQRTSVSAAVVSPK
jgi:hypothetical protein